MNFIKTNWFKIGILITLLLIASAVYQAFVIIPKDNARAEEIEKIFEQTRKDTEKIQKEGDLNQCLTDAHNTYDRNWINSCKTTGKLSSYCISITDDIDGFKNFLKDKGTTTESVSFELISEYSSAKRECSCLLPNVTASRWDDSLKEEKDSCYARYK